MDNSKSQVISMGVAVAFLLLVVAVWVSDVSPATGLALTALLILFGVGTYAATTPRDQPRDDSDVQRDRMREVP